MIDEDRVIQLAEKIYSTLTYSITGVKGTLKLPPKGQVSPPILIAVVDHILKQYFDIKLSVHQKNTFILYEPLYFQIPPEKGLPGRTVSSDFEAAPPQLHIIGKAPKAGEDGHTTVAFDWKKRSGTVNPDGTFDWKKINSVPSIRENEIIATVHNKTDGEPGIDCFGEKIQQRAGEPHKVRWAGECIHSDTNREDSPQFNLIAKASGVVDFLFRVEDDPSTMEWVKISDTLKIDGDIDYNFGDLDSAASLDIAGSVRGNFNLRSDGHIYVSGTIEGQEVCAKSVSADLITNRCFVSARDDIDTNSITNAEAQAEYIHIRQNASHSRLQASEKIIMDEAVSLTGLEIHTKYLTLNRPVISGKNEIFLGEKLFEKYLQLSPQIMERESEAKGLGREAKELATGILNTFVLVMKFTNKKYGTLVHNLLEKIKSNIINCFQALKEIHETTISDCYELFNTLGEKNAELALLRKVEYLCKALPRYNTVTSGLIKDKSAVDKLESELDDLVLQIKNDIAVNIVNPKTVGQNAELIIKCGDDELVLKGSDLTGTDKIIKYKTSDKKEILTKGKLQVL